MQKILLLMLVMQFLHANAIAKNDDILEELEFYLKNENKNTIREQNKSAIRQDLKISQQNLMEILDNKPRLTSDNNNLHALNNVIKINDSTVSSDFASSDLNFPQDNGVIANENNRKDGFEAFVKEEKKTFKLAQALVQFCDLLRELFALLSRSELMQHL